MLKAGAGEVRNIWSLLLWLNQPARINYIDQPAGSRIHRGKRVSYGRHKTVDIDLGRVINLRRHIKLPVERASPVRHKVRGAFHHSGGDKNCGHDWPLMPDKKGHWVCTRCGRMRWWVRDHVRGDATRGYNDNEYVVNVGD